MDTMTVNTGITELVGSHEKVRLSMSGWLAQFARNGFNVTEEAIEHNFDAWTMDFKSGYRDEENGYWLFTPCGDNPLSFTVERLNPDPSCDWQKTYVA